MLTDKQQRFVDEYLVDLNATQAAIRAGYSENTARAIGCENLTKPDIQQAIAAAQAERAQRVHVEQDMVLRHLIEIATADPNDLIQFRRGACPECYAEPEDDVEDQLERGLDTREPNIDCQACGGEGYGRAYIPDTRALRGPARRLYAGVKTTKDGVQVLMRSQDKALELLGDHLGLFKKVQIAGAGGGAVQHEVNLRHEVAGLSDEKLDAALAALTRVFNG